MSVRLFVGNLAYEVTEAELRELFSAAGTPSQVRLPTDRETGKPRGFAFVDFSDRSQAEEAIRRFHQQMFKGRALVVNEARARDARPPVRPSAAPRPSWTGDPVPAEDVPPPGQRRRTFGPDAQPRDRRRHGGRRTKGERAVKRPLKDTGGGQILYGTDVEEPGDDAEVDAFTMWAREDAKTEDDE